jgi:cytochrome bd-type quinol oxidase subunit 2
MSYNILMYYSHNRSVKNDKKTESKDKAWHIATIGFCVSGVGLLGDIITYIGHLFLLSSCTSGECITEAFNIIIATVLLSYGLILSLSAGICYLLNKLFLKTTKKILNVYVFAPILSIVLCGLAILIIRNLQQ